MWKHTQNQGENKSKKAAHFRLIKTVLQIYFNYYCDEIAFENIRVVKEDDIFLLKNIVGDLKWILID